MIDRLPVKDHVTFQASPASAVGSTNLSLQAPLPPIREVPKEAVLHVKAKEPTWFEVTVDGQDRFSLNMRPGEERTWLARQSFRVWIGFPMRLDIMLNQQALTLQSAQGGALRDVEIFTDGRVEYHQSLMEGP